MFHSVYDILSFVPIPTADEVQSFILTPKK